MATCLRSGRRIRLTDTPGHKTMGLVRGQALDDIAKGKVDGIINLVDYGYQDSEQLRENPDTALRWDRQKSNTYRHLVQ